MDRFKHSRHSYGYHVRQRLSVWEPLPLADANQGGVWAIFIHGGAWGDPSNTDEDFIPTVRHAGRSSQTLHVGGSPIRAFASIDYRLSPHPKHPQGPDTPASELRDARHPDHVKDVRCALQFLVKQYDLGSSKYILVGHSAGATLTLQLCMGLGIDDDGVLGGQAPPPSLPLPISIIGISGIYDLPGIEQRHDGQYAGFITSAFGSDRAAWAAASPAHYNEPTSEGRGSGWPTLPTKYLLAWSRQDTLVDEPEIDAMFRKLKTARDVYLDITKDLTGDHDVVWQEGSQLWELIKTAADFYARAPSQVGWI